MLWRSCWLAVWPAGSRIVRIRCSPQAVRLWRANSKLPEFAKTPRFARSQMASPAGFDTLAVYRHVQEYQNLPGDGL